MYVPPSPQVYMPLNPHGATSTPIFDQNFCHGIQGYKTKPDQSVNSTNLVDNFSQNRSNQALDMLWVLQWVLLDQDRQSQ